jgi:hypothetical protein
MGRNLGQAGASRYVHLASFVSDGKPANGGSQLLGTLPNRGGIDRGEDHCEFLTAKSCKDFVATHLRSQHIRDLDERVIANDVPKGVIELFEVIDVEHQERCWAAAALPLLLAAAEFFVERATVKQSCQAVGAGRCDRIAQLPRMSL